ncbi:MAG: L-threonylcarbamoyladenylate synthase [Rhodospirillaceae bacterium]
MTIRSGDKANITKAARSLRLGGLVAFPTETVYGLGADATQDTAIAQIYALKERPALNPLIVHVGRPDWVAGLATPDGRFDALTRAFWPGPLTLILRRRADSPIGAAVSAGLDTIAVRQPNHPVAAALLTHVKRPLAAPSANPSGQVSPTTAKHVFDDFGDRLNFILDGGPCTTGIESTVLDLTATTARILRAGVVGVDALEKVIGSVTPPDIVQAQEMEGSISSPGQLEKHYSPSLPVRLNAQRAIEDEALIGFGKTPRATLNLSPTGNLDEAAASLFAALRSLDDPKRFRGIAIVPIPTLGVGQAINDRLLRASKGR